VPFLQAVFCLKGFDDRSRFFAISIIALFGFIFFSAVFSDYTSISLATLLILTLVLTCSTKRRLHDAKLNKNWQLVPGGLFLLTGLLSLIIENSNSYYLLILPALSAALLLTYPSKNDKTQNRYIFGYVGPVDLSSYLQQPSVDKAHNQRIEPTLAADGTSQHLYISESIIEQTVAPESDSDSKQIDIGELIRFKFLGNRKLQLAVIACVATIFIAVFINSLMTSSAQKKNEPNQVGLIEQKTVNKSNAIDIIDSKSQLLAMPDNFNLYLSKYQGVIIHWQADEVANGELWSQLSAKGDKSCQNIQFNKGAPLRPLSVSVKNSSEYFASFSPMDSAELIKALAFRGKFSLCGYSFSLKGSQGALGKHAHYANFLEQDA